ncbi:hypothetical protein [Streptomyces prasinus]
MFKSGVGFLALFGLGWCLLGSSAFGGLMRQVLIAVGCAVMVGLMFAARRFLPSSAGGGRSPLADVGGSTRSTGSSGC